MVLFVQGMRNRPVLRLWPTGNLIAFVVVAHHEYWRVESHCFPVAGLVCLTIVIAALIIMCVHQLLPRAPLTRSQT